MTKSFDTKQEGHIMIVELMKSFKVIFRALEMVVDVFNVER